jgi:hypothetical protein
MSIQYLNKDFSQLQQALVNYIKNNYQNYTDFGPSSPGNMFVDLSAYVGDILSFYTDTQVQETLLLEAKEFKNILPIAYSLGYSPKVTRPSSVVLDVYQLMPSDASAGYAPDWRYTLRIPENSQIQSTSQPSISFLTENLVDFGYSSSFDPTNVSVYSYYNNTSNPLFYILKKQVRAFSGQVKTANFTFTNAEQFQQVVLNDTNIIQIVEAVDSDGNTWYEVPYLAQDTIIDKTYNISVYEPNYSQYNDQAPFMLRLKKVNKRFTAQFLDSDSLQISFGAGTTGKDSELIIPNPDNVGLGIQDGISAFNTAFDPSNFFFTNEYGQSPVNTTITFTYIVGGGAQSNVPANDININQQVNPQIDSYGLNSTAVQTVVNSIRFNNIIGATGGGPGDSIEEIRLNALANFPTQLRNVTKSDYLVRILSMPSEFGYISKAYVVQDLNLNADRDNTQSIVNMNPLALSAYVLSTNTDGKLTTANQAVKQNLKTYLSQYKMLTDAVTIKDAFYVNIGINFEIQVLQGFNAQQVLIGCIEALKTFFSINKWSINQPIILSQVENCISCGNVNGVAAVKNIEFVNKAGGLYSPYTYDLQGATLGGIIYPSLDPMIFEIRYPDNDILGRVVGA